VIAGGTSRADQIAARSGGTGEDREMTNLEQDTAPAALQPILDLVNTTDLESGIEELREPGALRAWLVERRLLDPATEVSAADLAFTIELREALRAMLRVNDGHPMDAGAVETVNRVTGALPLRLRFSTDGEPALGPSAGGVRGALAGLLSAVALAEAQGTWSRLKVCSADTCQWAFYDKSKNRSGRWCSMRVCGNRTKTRAYRARQRD
jgi:predicted RNA-binding Zn ribbon-like protein